MTLVGLVGDATTTSAVAIAATWPRNDDVTVVEADPRGGSLAGWLDTPEHPSLATIVAHVGEELAPRPAPILETLETLDAMTHRSASGVRFIANAVRSRAANRALEEAARVVLPVLAESPTVAIADTGTHVAGDAPSSALRLADVIVIVHRQANASAAAATVRIERLLETVEELAHLDARFVLAVIGSTPFEPDEIGAFVDRTIADTIVFTAALADDPLSAAAIAGRTGVSAKRLRRLPLLRDAARLATAISGLLQVGPRAETRLVEDGSP